MRSSHPVASLGKLYCKRDRSVNDGNFGLSVEIVSLGGDKISFYKLKSCLI